MHDGGATAARTGDPTRDGSSRRPSALKAGAKRRGGRTGVLEDGWLYRPLLIPEETPPFEHAINRRPDVTTLVTVSDADGDVLVPSWCDPRSWVAVIPTARARSTTAVSASTASGSTCGMRRSSSSSNAQPPAVADTMASSTPVRYRVVAGVRVRTPSGTPASKGSA